MDIIPLTLGIARPVRKAGAGGPVSSKGADSQDSAAGKIPAETKQRIFERDHFTCRCCHFQSKKYQEVHALNNDNTDLRDKNLITVCIFCHQCFNLEKVSEMRSGVLLWLPEIEQARLHHIARAIYVARISQGPVAEAARKSLDALMARREEVKRRLQTDDPYILATVLRDYLGDQHYERRESKLKGVRLFPLDRRIIKEADLEFNQFPQILAYWRSKDGPFGKKTPPQWVSIYQTILAQTG
ncbi:MAG: HNH endonuclease [Alphaproteobacteria bacterium]|nr:HNH endonuclease [Alphaproteobacteria bacterium]